jgi:hypothetical protein
MMTAAEARTYHWKALHAWSSVHGGKVCRVSMWDAGGQEHFVVVVLGGHGRTDRERIYSALEAVVESIEGGREPGEVEFKQ